MKAAIRESNEAGRQRVDGNELRRQRAHEIDEAAPAEGEKKEEEGGGDDLMQNDAFDDFELEPVPTTPGGAEEREDPDASAAAQGASGTAGGDHLEDEGYCSPTDIVGEPNDIAEMADMDMGMVLGPEPPLRRGRQSGMDEKGNREALTKCGFPISEARHGLRVPDVVTAPMLAGVPTMRGGPFGNLHRPSSFRFWASLG